MWKGLGMLFGKFESTPLKKTSLGMAQTYLTQRGGGGYSLIYWL